MTLKLAGHGVGGGAGAGGVGGGGPGGTGIGTPSIVIFGVKVLQSRVTDAFVHRRVKMPGTPSGNPSPHHNYDMQNSVIYSVKHA